MPYTLKKFSELTPFELYKLLKLRQDVFVLEQTCLYPDLDDKDQNAAHMLAFEGENLVGCLRILAPGVSYAEASIGRVVVAQNHRRQGIAQHMMRRAFDHLGKQNVRISAQSYALECYQSVGFRVVSDEYLEDGIPHREMLREVE